jgi:NAD(P)-dependent dehydrogenase (short-subunit alcohol dehydrogenase family)
VDLQLDGKVALATGASKGIGRHVAGHLAAQGSEAAITARMPGPLELTAGEIQPATDRRVLALTADMCVAAGVARCVAATENRPGPIDILVTRNDGLQASYREMTAGMADINTVGVAGINFASPRASFIDGAHIPVDGAQRKAIMDR